jgi:seryl-tRNA(Sec) selenium transferase
MTAATEALRQIKARWPKLNAEGLRRVFEATIIEDNELRRAIVAESFARALAELQKKPVAPPPHM